MRKLSFVDMADLSDDDQQSDTSYTSTSVYHDLSHEGSDKALSFEHGMCIDDSKDLITYDNRDYTDVEESTYDSFELQCSDTSVETLTNTCEVLKSFHVYVMFVNCKN